jgi:hypothetical protein
VGKEARGAQESLGKCRGGLVNLTSEGAHRFPVVEVPEEHIEQLGPICLGDALKLGEAGEAELGKANENHNDER